MDFQKITEEEAALFEKEIGWDIHKKLFKTKKYDPAVFYTAILAGLMANLCKIRQLILNNSEMSEDAVDQMIEEIFLAYKERAKTKFNLTEDENI